jgi:5-methylcytosine-specific restriction endonuclease McrA
MSDTLVLNADGQPVSMIPPSTIQWKEAITYLWLDKVHVLEWYDDWMVRSSSWETRVPAVIMLKDMMKRKQTPRFSRYNLYLRDMFTCQYCYTQLPTAKLTMDHVLPISKGGKTNWENIVTACNPCNGKKGNDERIRPKTRPYQPDYFELANKRKQIEFTIKHPSWEQFLR